jgi:hypothetical protein
MWFEPRLNRTVLRCGAVQKFWNLRTARCGARFHILEPEPHHSEAYWILSISFLLFVLQLIFYDKSSLYYNWNPIYYALESGLHLVLIGPIWTISSLLNLFCLLHLFFLLLLSSFHCHGPSISYPR